MLKPDQMEPLSAAGLDAQTLKNRPDPAAFVTESGEPVGVFLPLEFYARYRQLLKADEIPEELLDPIPMDAAGRPVGLTTAQLTRQLETLAAGRVGGDGAAGGT